MNDGIKRKKNKESWNNQKEKKTKSSMQGLGLNIFFFWADDLFLKEKESNKWHVIYSVCNLDVAGKTGGGVFLVENSFVNLFSSKNHPKKNIDQLNEKSQNYVQSFLSGCLRKNTNIKLSLSIKTLWH